MKSFLMTAIIGMLVAGIYGTVDLTLDIKNGTLIEYEDEDVMEIAAFAGNRTGAFAEDPAENVSRKKAVYTENEKLKLAKVRLKDFSLSDIDISDFSRGEPPMTYDALLDEPMAPDSLVNAEVVSALNDTVAAIHEKINKEVKKDSSGIVKEERKLSLKLYSRGRPPRLVKREEVTLKSDSTPLD